MAARVVAWRWGRGGALRGGVPCGFLRGCSPSSPCRCALHPPCNFWWLVGVRWCDPYGVRCLLWRCVLGGCAPGSPAALGGGGAALVPMLCYALPGFWSWRPPWCPFPLCLGPRSCPFLGGLLPPCCVSSGALSLWVPALTWGLSVPSCLNVPCCPLLSPCPCPSPSRCGGGGVARGRRWPRPGGGWPGAIGGGLGGCRGGRGPRPQEEGLPCRLRNDGFRGGLVGVGGGAGAHRLEGVPHVHLLLPSRSPGPLHRAAKLLQNGGRPPGEVGGGPGGGGVRAQGPGAAGGGRGPAVVARLAVPGGAGAAVAGARGGGRLRAEGGTGGGGGHGAAVARLMAPRGAGVVVAGAGGCGWVWAAGGTGSPAGSVGGRGGGRGAAVACLAAPRGAAAVVAGAGGGGLVRPEGGGGGGHGAAVALVVAPGGAGAAGAESWGVVVAPGGAGAARVGG